MDVEISIVGGSGKIEAFFGELIKNGQKKVQKFIGQWGGLLETRVKANAEYAIHAPGAARIHPFAAPGLVGPEKGSGDYQRSIELETTLEPPSTYVAIVGTNSEQGARLEFGFSGTDAHGRNFEEAHPYPHFGPALDELTPRFSDAANKLLP